MTRPRQKVVISLLLFSIVLVLILNALSAWTYKRGLAALVEDGKTRLELYVNYLQGVLEKYESLPELLAIDNSFVSALLNPHEKARISTLNRYLETINKVSDTQDTYLMNRDGLTIAASNWNKERPFIGRNFSYRPYFKEAMKGKLGRYFALGTTSAKRGYYFAYPVRKDEVILGAVVVKISIDSVEQKWAQRDDNFLVSDPDGVIFITTNPDWRYKTFSPLEKDVLQRIRESRRYPDGSFQTISDSAKKISHDLMTFDIDPGRGKERVNVVKQSHFMPQAGWDVHMLSDTRKLKRNVFFVTVIFGSTFTLAFILLLLLIQRRQRVEQLKHVEQKAKFALQEANEQLETRVQDRTQKLTEANLLLKKEIQERKETEVKLKKTRKELIHAAKLAVLGQMSAGINHELNQPLAAIRSYTDNGRQFLEKGRLKEALWNLEQIGELIDRMAQIGVQLKLFSRKSSGQIVAVPLHAVVDGAMEIVNPALKKAGVTINIEIQPENVEVRSNNVLLQQVLVNLISNGIQALEGQGDKIIKIQGIAREDKVLIAVEDNGPGVSNKHQEEIFEPFFTTKKSGHGLGLGLAISDRIVRELGGKIYHIKTDIGARFELLLDKTK